MKTAVFIALSFFSSLAFSQSSLDEGVFLDPKYSNLVPPKKAPLFIDQQLRSDLPEKSPTALVIAKQTPVKSQEARGTCSIFSATAFVESQLIEKRNYANDLDLSEQWLEYVKASILGIEGSDSWSNFEYLRKYGITYEASMPYIGETWDSLEYSTQSNDRCSPVPEELLKKCLIGHKDPRLLNLPDETLSNPKFALYDPFFLAARSLAFGVRDRDLLFSSTQYRVSNVTEIKKKLAQGESMILDVDFFYGAWNHRKAEEFGMTRNHEHWEQGVVGYPERNSLDRVAAQKSPAGHSIVIVGYDDTKEVTVTQPLKGGTLITKTYKGVYYFKNSWGTYSFGSGFSLDEVSYPGYGMITQDYAHEFGSFYQFTLQPK